VENARSVVTVGVGSVGSVMEVDRMWDSSRPGDPPITQPQHRTALNRP
jgi:hypothetical protein